MQGSIVNVNKLKGKIVENGLSVAGLAAKIGIDRATLYRKLSNNGETMLVKDANNIAAALNLSADEALAIFFSQTVA
ncbi:MAG: helix-turn-helix transcriptional regulator [Synergistaceae bacterium]|nr:helix-turn-helix transcriptional regulator [Synergistaceae bacterium]